MRVDSGLIALLSHIEATSPFRRETTLHKRTAFLAKEYDLPPDLGELIHRDVDLIRDKGWETFVKERRGRGDMASLDQLDSHPARRLLKMYKHR